MSKAERRRTRVSSTIDKLPDDIKGQLDVRLADTSNTYEELAAWLKTEGYEISKSAIGRYAIRTTQAAQRVAQTIQRTQAIAQAVEAHPDLDYTKAASMVLMDGLMQRVSTAEDDFQDYTDIVYIGTLLHFDALLANVAKNPSYKSVRYQGVISFATNGELWDAWESIFTDLSNDNRQEDALEFFQANREAMLEGTAVLWEEKLSYYDLMVIRISEGEASFNSEIQNDPIDPENCTFQEEWFDFWDDEGKAQPDFSDPKFLFVGANDPSLGKNKKSDTSSIIALAKDTQTGYLYVVIADIAKRKPDQIIEDALDASRRLQREYKRPYYKFGVETVQFQYYFAEIMRQRAAAVGEYLPIEEINSTQNKDARIQSLQPFVKNGYIKFSKKHKTLLKQMTEYPMGKNDDAPDGLQMAVKLALDVKIGRRVDYRSVIARALDFRRGAY